MRVLVTGAGGFIGSHVVEELLGHDYHVRALVHYNSESSEGSLRYLAPEARTGGLEVVFGDVRDGHFMMDVTEGCDAVLHLAALIGIPYSYVAPGSYLDTNVRGTLHVLEAARVRGLRRVVVTSTSEVYGTARYTPIDESHPLQAQSPYSASKIGADMLTDSYVRSFELPAVVLRPFNTFGPRQSARAVIPTILSQLVGDAPELRLGSLTPKRDLVFVKDTARAFRLALEAEGIDGRTIHFGTGRAVSIGELADLARQVTGRDVPVVEEEARVRPEKSEVQLLLADPSRAEELLGWAPAVTLEDGLRAVAGFIEANAEDYDLGRYAI